MELTNQEKSLLSFQVGPFRLCVQATEAEAILELPEIHSIPLTPLSIAGMFLYRERVAAAVDVSKKLGFTRDSEVIRGQLIIAPMGEDIYGFLVDTVHELIPAENIGWNSLQGLMQIEAFEHFGVLDDEIILFTSFESLLNMKEISPDDSSLRTFVASNRSELPAAADQTEDETLSESTGGENLPESVGAITESESQANAGYLDTASASGQSTEGIAEGQEYAEDDDTEIPEDAVSQREIEIFKEETQKYQQTGKQSETVRQGGNRQFAQNRNRPSGTRQGRPSQQSGRVNQQRRSYQTRPVQEERSAFADAFTKKTLSIAAGIAVVLAAGILFLSGGADEQPSQVNMASIGSQPSVQHDQPEAQPDISYKTAGANQQTGTHAEATEESSVKEEPASKVITKSEPASRVIGTPEPANEILRVDTDDFTLTVERAIRSAPGQTTETDGYQDNDAGSSPAQAAIPVPDVRHSEFPAAGAPDADRSEQPDKTSAAITEAVPLPITAVSDTKPPVPDPQKTEYVHVVKRGDTLWEISKQYLGNPLRYPELARLSHISDPDWIYPGDVVRIRRK